MHEVGDAAVVVTVEFQRVVELAELLEGFVV